MLKEAIILTMKKKILILTILCIFFYIGCDIDWQDTGNEVYNQVKKQAVDSVINYSEWHQITPGMEIKEFTDSSAAKIVTAIKIKPENFSFKILQEEDNPVSVNDWRGNENAILVINAVYFDENYLPTGYLLASSGIEYNTPYYMGENNYTGAFVVNDDGSPEVRYLPIQNYGLTELKMINSTFQTFPTLITTGGNKAELKSSISTAKRTVLAQDEDLNIYIFITQTDNFTLAEIRDFIFDLDLEIDTAINLDGGTSSGISIKKDDFSYGLSSFYVPSVIAVYGK